MWRKFWSVAWLACVVLWECVRYPHRPSSIRVGDDGRVIVTRW